MRSPVAPSLCALCSALIAVCGCHKEAPPEKAPATEAASAVVAAGAAPASEFHEPTFDLTVRVNDGYAVGAEGSFDVIIVPKGGYHTNDKYPYKLRLQPADGVKYPADVVTREAVTLEPMRATMKVPVVPTASGSKQVGGQLSFSVCSPENCMVEKRDVVATLRVN